MANYVILAGKGEPARVYGKRNHCIENLRVGDETPLEGKVLWTGNDYKEALAALHGLAQRAKAEADLPLLKTRGDRR